MSAENAAPIIIKRKKVVGGDAHHGGAWKVAYADFVTAMMAFFMLMWLLNATTEQQRKGIADYFSPTVPINRISGGGSGAFGGDNIFTQETLAQSGTGGVQQVTLEGGAYGNAEGDAAGSDESSQVAALREVEEKLLGVGGESLVSEQALRHIVTRVTDEGLVIELFSSEDEPLFVGDTTEPTQLMTEMAVMLVGVLSLATNDISVTGHVRSQPLVVADNQVWPLSSERAGLVLSMMVGAGLDPDRFRRVTGHADRKPAVRNTLAIRNDRIEITLLR